MKRDFEPSPDSLRASLRSAVSKLDEIKAKVCINESRLIALEKGTNGSRILWDDDYFRNYCKPHATELLEARKQRKSKKKNFGIKPMF